MNATIEAVEPARVEQQDEHEADNFYHAAFSATADLSSALEASCPCGALECEHRTLLKAARGLIKRAMADLAVAPVEVEAE